MGHGPKIQGGNGRPPTCQEKSIYQAISEYDSTFEIECIVRTGLLRKEFKAPTHYKVDVGSHRHKLAIEIDGASHNSLKVKECDKRKTELLNLKGWTVLRFSNSMIENQLDKCVQKVLSMI